MSATVKTHQTVQLRSVNFNVCKLYIKEEITHLKRQALVTAPLKKKAEPRGSWGSTYGIRPTLWDQPQYCLLQEALMYCNGLDSPDYVYQGQDEDMGQE